VGDGQIKDLKLKSEDVKIQTIEKSALLTITGIEKKKLKYHLTNQGEIGTKLYSLFPGLINNTVKNEMKKLNNDETEKVDEKSEETEEEKRKNDDLKKKKEEDDGVLNEFEVKNKSVHDFKVLDIDKNEVDLGIYKGYVKLFVNVASF
jgi:hypothetical protein